MAQRALDVQYAALGVQVEQQGGGGGQCCRRVRIQVVATAEQEAEQFIP